MPAPDFVSRPSVIFAISALALANGRLALAWVEIGLGLGQLGVDVRGGNFSQQLALLRRGRRYRPSGS